MIQIQLRKQLDAPTGPMNLKIDCELESKKLFTIYGDSGAGKTSILRMLAGLMQPEEGKIVVNGETWFDSKAHINLRPQSRKIGFVFQDYALFPNMTVKQQILYGLENRNDVNTIDQLLDSFELGDLHDRKPGTLSGGQKQRVALARALARKPHLLLLDEPLSALGFSMRQKLQDYIMSVHKKYSLSTILVSHDIGEVFRLSDEIIWIDQGKIKKRGLPVDVFSHKHSSGNFQLTGEVLKIEKVDVIYITTVLIGNSLVKVIAEETEAAKLRPGDKVLVASKAFYPIIQKLE